MDKQNQPDSDHDLLIRIDARMESFVTEVRTQNQQFTSQVNDHEARMRVLESNDDRREGSVRALRLMVGAVGVIVGLIEPVALFYLGNK